MSEPLYGDKALELFFGNNASGVATAMWATAMRNNYEDRVAKLEQQVEFWKSMALQLKDEMVKRGDEIEGKDNYIALILSKNRMAVEMLAGYDSQVRELAERLEKHATASSDGT